MNKDEIIRRLADKEPAIRAMGVDHLHLYGSYAHGTPNGGSDVDLFFDRDMSFELGLIELARLQFFLQSILGVDVDVGTRTSLHPRLKSDIEQSSVQVF